MDMKEYGRQAKLTLAGGRFYGDKVVYAQFMRILWQFATTAQALDDCKKALFYGKGQVGSTNAFGIEDASAVIKMIAPPIEGETEEAHKARQTKAINLVHAIIGVATEAGEMVAELHNAVRAGRPLDLVNLAEEGGDEMWYLNVLFDECDTDFEGAADGNIAKLRERFGERFDEYDAIHRDLKRERAVLDGHFADTADASPVGNKAS